MKRQMKRRQQILIWALSLIVVASMVCSFAASMSPRDREATPTPEIAATATATHTATALPNPPVTSAPVLEPPTATPAS